jgi:hypothetical protein
MPDEDFLDELPVGKNTTQPAKVGDMADALTAAARPAKKVINRVVRPVASPPAGEEAATASPPRPVTKPATRPVVRPVTKSVTKPAPVTPPKISGSDILPPPGDQAAETNDAAELLQSLPTSQSRLVPRPEVVDGKPMDFVEEVAATDRDINRRWDEFLVSLEQGTLIALYELGVESLTQFRDFSYDDLKKPRGRLTDAQAREVRDKLVGFGVQLSRTNRVSSLRQGGGQTRIRGLRAPARGLPPPPADATPSQRRQHRMARNRLTM